MTFALLLSIGAALFLAFSNGANDNFKGVATLFGSRTTSYQLALFWATTTTLLGSAAAFFFAQRLIGNFTGKGLVPEAVVGLSSFSTSVALAAASTVLLATRFGFPISTTHALTGALIGAGLQASHVGINGGKLLTGFMAPLLLSPLLAIALAFILYPLFKAIRKRLQIVRTSCICLGNEVIVSAPHGFPSGASSAVLRLDALPSFTVGTNVTCEERYVGQLWGLSAKKVLDVGHFLSAGLVSFARGLNDTPKIAAVILAGKAMTPHLAIFSVGLVMAGGGLLLSRRIAETMSFGITKMNDGQGFSGNLVTSLIVLSASHLGLPVSTTHVSCGALFGIGTVTGQADLKSISKIVSSWIITLPVAALLGFLIFSLLSSAFG